MKFVDPIYLLLLIALPFVAWGLQCWQCATARKLRTLSRAPVRSVVRTRVQFVLLLLAVAMLIIAMARPQWGKRAEEVHVYSRNLMMVVDVSRSMLAADVHPNRLARAKADLVDLVEALKGDRAGIIAFRKKAILLCPLTRDKAYLRQTIAGISPASAPKGETDMAEAIQVALQTLQETGEGHSAIVLISDGEDLAGRIEPLATRAGELKIPIFTVGIGSTKGSTIRDDGALVTFENKAVETKLTESTLKTIARLSGGHYIPLATASMAQTTLGSVYANYLSRIADEEQMERIDAAFVDRDGIFVVLAVLLAMGAAGCSLGRVSAVRLGLLFVCGVASLRAEMDPALAAQSAYRKGDYKTAATTYEQALRGAEASQAPLYAYNRALAEWKDGNVTNALDALTLALTDADFAGRAATLEGTLLLQQAENTDDLTARLTLRERAVQAFTQALQRDPSAAAKRNLARAKEGLPRLREDVRRLQAIDKAKDTQLPQLFSTLLTHQRKLDQGAAETFNGPDPEVRISQADTLAKELREVGSQWYAVEAKLQEAVTNETQRAELLTHAVDARHLLDAAADQFETLDSSLATLAKVEPITYNFWKMVADPPALNGEALGLMTKEVEAQRAAFPPRENLAETLALVQQFRMIFPTWAEEALKQAQQQAAQPPVEGDASTEAASTEEKKATPPSFTEEDRDIIARTADATVPLLQTATPSTQTRTQILDNLKLIQSHLPRNPNQNQQQNNQDQQNNQNQNQDQKNQQQQSKDQQQQNQQQDQQKASEKSAEEQKQQDEARDVKARLQQAVDRERAHESEKEKRAEALNSSPDQRDW